MTIANEGYVFAIPRAPEPVGYWVLYTEGPMRTKFPMYHKPTAEQIANTEQLLGWGWKDAE